jgi:hypothetical protein
MRNAYKILVGKPEGKRPLGRPKRNGRIMLELVSEKQGRKAWARFIWLRIVTSGGLL